MNISIKEMSNFVDRAYFLGVKQMNQGINFPKFKNSPDTAVQSPITLEQ